MIVVVTINHNVWNKASVVNEVCSENGDLSCSIFWIDKDALNQVWNPPSPLLTFDMALTGR